MNTLMNRRRFLQRSFITSAGLLAAPYFLRGQASPNNKLNIGVIGTAGRASGNIAGVQHENIVALCDVDETNLNKAGERFPTATKHRDFRRLLDQKGIDAVVVSTPDHTHAVCAVAAMRSGRHVYCEKPLARTVSEVRIMTDTAQETKRVTQMGNQIHSQPGNNYRRVVELVQSGAIGAVKEVHVWAGATYGKMPLAENPPPPPATLDYDLWLGPVQYLSYRPEYAPFKWRNFWHFGGGTLADFWCHFGDLAHWALELKYPTTIAAEGPDVDPEFVPADLKVTYEYPARGPKPPVQLTWYQGKYRPADQLGPLLDKWRGGGVLFIGEKGRVLADYSRRVLLPEDQFAGFQPPAPFVPDAKGNNWHHQQWIDACKSGGVAECNFEYGGPLSEAGLLGNVAFRVGKKLQWNARTLKAKDCPEADQYIQHQYREGWKI